MICLKEFKQRKITIITAPTVKTCSRYIKAPGKNYKDTYYWENRTHFAVSANSLSVCYL